MKSLSRTLGLPKNSFNARLRPSLPRVVTPSPCVTVSPAKLTQFVSRLYSSPTPAVDCPTLLENHHHHHYNCSRPPSHPRTEKHPFSTLSHAPSLQQRHLQAPVTNGRKNVVAGWRFSQSLLGAMWRFQSQLNYLCANEVSAKVKAPGRSIECEELIQMVEEGVRFLLIDVRDTKEVETTGFIQGAKLIPLPELKSALLMDEDDFILKYGFPKPAKSDRNIVFYGQGAVKSNSALEIAGKLGYKGVLRMAGGYDEWILKTHLDGRI